MLCTAPPAPATPPTRRPAPHHDGGVLRGAGDDVVVVGTPVDVQHGRRVSRDQRVVLVHPSCLQRRGTRMSPLGETPPGSPRKARPGHHVGCGTNGDVQGIPAVARGWHLP